MGKNNEALKEKINKLAIEWSELDHQVRNGDDSEQIRIKMHTIRQNIWIKVYEMFAGNQKIRHWVSDNKFTEDVVYVGKSEVLYDDFIDIIDSSLDASKQGRYDIDKSNNYIAYIHTLAGLRKNNKKGGSLKLVSRDTLNDESDSHNINIMSARDELFDSEIMEISDLNSANIIIDLVINFISDYEKYLPIERKELGKSHIKEIVAVESIYTYFIVWYIEQLKSFSSKRVVKNGKKVPESSWDMDEEDYEICCKYDVKFEYLRKRDYHIFKFLKLFFVSNLKEVEVDELKDLKIVIKRKLRENVDLSKRYETIKEYMSTDIELKGQKVARQWVSERYDAFFETLKKIKANKKQFGNMSRGILKRFLDKRVTLTNLCTP